MKINIHKINKANLDWKRSLHYDHREIVTEASDLYPGIDIWYDRKAKPGIEIGERIGYLITKDNRPLGAAIAKQGADAKICTVRIRDEAVNEGLGSILFFLLAYSLRKDTNKVHFTAPESLWNEYENFFLGMGFTRKGRANKQYRLFDEEIAASADYRHFKMSVFKKYLPKFAGLLAQIDNEKVDVILSLKPEYAHKIINRTKIMELRRKFSTKWIGSNALIYSSSPEKAFVAKIKIGDVVKDKPIAIWHQWKEAIDCGEEEFINYTQDVDEIYGIIIDDVKSIGPVYLSAIEHYLEDTLHPPQSYLKIANNAKWESVVSISHLMMQNI